MQRRVLFPFLAAVVVAAVACDQPLPIAPTPIEEERPLTTPGSVWLTVTIACSLCDCASLAPGIRVVFTATVTGGSGHYTYRWSTSAGTLYGSPGRDGTQRWIAPAEPGAAYVTVNVSDRAQPDVDPLEAEIRVIVLQADREPPGGGTPDGTVRLIMPATVMDGTRTSVTITGGVSPYALVTSAGGWCTRTDSPPCTGGVGLTQTRTVNDDTNLVWSTSGMDPGDTAVLEVTDAAGARDRVMVRIT